jgi:two-component system LytT family sensor kinase
LAQSPFFTGKFTRVFIAWWLIWFALQALLLYWEGFGWRIALTDSFVFNFLTAGACWLVTLTFQFYLPRQERFWYILALSIALSLCIIFLSRWVLELSISENIIYLTMLKNWLPIRFGIVLLMIGCMAMISVLWYTFQDHQETDNRRTTAESLKKEAELIALRRQLQPHFLFNSLNSISALVGTKPDEARKMIQQLSDFLRGTIKKENDQFVLLAEELVHLQLYLDIERLRFGHRLNTIINTDVEIGKLKLPVLILQPVVENAIKFGLYDTTESVTITITCRIENNNLLLTVSNPYDPETAQSQMGEGFGLSSVKRRLYLLFARNDLVETQAINRIFTTIIKIPQQI